MNVLAHNRASWDRLVDEQDRWTRPVSAQEVERARRGEFDLLLTPSKPVPKSWFPGLDGTLTLCLGSGGGQQGPLLAAAGANVTVLDNSPRQLGQDRFVAERDGLHVETVQGDMANLSEFRDGSFQLIVHPCSNCFVPDIRPVWRECSRILCHGGVLLSGFTNPLRYLFDEEQAPPAGLLVHHAIPYSDVGRSTPSERLRELIEGLLPLVFGHTLADQIGGQIDAGFLISGFFEDRYKLSDNDPISAFIDTFIATRAIKP